MLPTAAQGQRMGSQRYGNARAENAAFCMAWLRQGMGCRARNARRRDGADSDATAKQSTANRWLSEAMHGEGVAQQSRGATIVKEPGQEGQEMAITDELRAWWLCKFPIMDSELHKEFTAIVKRIDSEHAALAAKSDRQREQLAAMEDALRRRNEGELKRRWQREIDALRDERDELREAVRLSEAKASDMVELPKDADGEVIRIGDKVTCGASVWEVTGFRLAGGGWGICCTIFFDQGGSGTNVYPPSELHHYHAPTVEDVLRDMHMELNEVTALYVGEAIDSDERDRDEARIFAEYASKLRLVESEDE